MCVFAANLACALLAAAIEFGTWIGVPFTPRDATAGTVPNDPFQQARLSALRLFTRRTLFPSASLHNIHILTLTPDGIP